MRIMHDAALVILCNQEMLMVQRAIHQGRSNTWFFVSALAAVLVEIKRHRHVSEQSKTSSYTYRCLLELQAPFPFLRVAYAHDLS